MKRFLVLATAAATTFLSLGLVGCYQCGRDKRQPAERRRSGDD